MPVNHDTVSSIRLQLLAVRKDSLTTIVAEDSTFPSSLASAVLDLTDVRTACQFFGQTILEIESQNCVPESKQIGPEEGGSYALLPTTMVSLELKCYRRWEELERDMRENLLPGLTLDDTKIVMGYTQPGDEKPQGAVAKFFHGFLKAIGSQCLSDLRGWWMDVATAPVTVKEVQILMDGERTRSFTRAPGSVVGSPRPALPSNLLEVPSPIEGSPAVTVYSTGLVRTGSFVASSSPSVALGALGRSTDDPITYEEGEYGKQMAHSKSYYNQEVVSRQASQHGDPDTLSDPSPASVGSPESETFGVRFRNFRLGRKSPASSTKPSKSRDVSVSGSEPARTTRPSPSPKPFIIASTSPVIISRDGKGFIDKDGTGARDESQPLIGLLAGLDKLTRDKFLSPQFVSNLYAHAGKCQLKFYQDPSALIEQRIGSNSQQIPLQQPGHVDFGFQRTGGASGAFVFNLICFKEDHIASSLECTKRPFMFRHPVDLGPILEALEEHSAQRAMMMMHDTAHQLLIAAEAEVAERLLEEAAAAAAGGSGQV